MDLLAQERNGQTEDDDVRAHDHALATIAC